MIKKVSFQICDPYPPVLSRLKRRLQQNQSQLRQQRLRQRCRWLGAGTVRFITVAAFYFFIWSQICNVENRLPLFCFDVSGYCHGWGQSVVQLTEEVSTDSSANSSAEIRNLDCSAIFFIWGQSIPHFASDYQRVGVSAVFWMSLSISKIDWSFYCLSNCLLLSISMYSRLEWCV